MTSNLPTIATLKKGSGYDSIQAYIEIWLLNLISFLNVGKSMSGEQISETASLIVDEFYMLNIADVNLVIKRAKAGQFGQVYDRIDGQVIIGWFRKYFQERCSLSADKSINESFRFKESNAPTFDKIVKLSNNKSIM